MSLRKRVVLGISSGIAAFKVLGLIDLLQKENLDIVVMMTENATHMIDVEEVQKKTGNEVYTTLFRDNFDYKKVLNDRHVDHIDLADSADLMVFVPATANIIAKLSHGLADDFVTTTALAATCPRIIFPSMNVHMWQNPLVQENIILLKKAGYIVIDPSTGPLACGYEGKGRLPDISLIADEIIRCLDKKNILSGKRIIITAGGTQEKIDDVRFITNRSSGKMGIALADVCKEYGAQVVLIRSENSVTPQYMMEEHTFVTADDLENLLKKHIKTADIIIHAAAISDFTIEEQQKGKLSSKDSYTLHLEPRKKIVDQLKVWNPSVFLVAFKAEYGLSSEQLIAVSQAKRVEIQADMFIANDISKTDRGFQSENNEVIVITGTYIHTIRLAAKRVIAQHIISSLVTIFGQII